MSDAEEKPATPFSIVEKREGAEGTEFTVLRDGEFIDVPHVSEENYLALKALLEALGKPHE